MYETLLLYGNAGIQQPQPVPEKKFKEMYVGHKQKVSSTLHDM